MRMAATTLRNRTLGRTLITTYPKIALAVSHTVSPVSTLTAASTNGPDSGAVTSNYRPALSSCAKVLGCHFECLKICAENTTYKPDIISCINHAVAISVGLEHGILAK